METVAALWDLVVHLDSHLAAFVSQHGTWVYALLFAIVFCETGLVVPPFLPGDSLLFVSGALAAAGGMDIVVVMSVLVSAALCGDNVNYWIGRWAGPRVFHYRESRWFNPKHLEHAHAFYEKHGGKTIILARFMPIIRTFAPVVAGMGKMEYHRFLSFNVVGGFLWVVSMTLIGYYLGQFAWVKKNIEIVIVIVVFLSILPGIIAAAREWLKKKRTAAA